MNEAGRMAILFRAAAEGAVAKKHPPLGWDWEKMGYWTGVPYSDTESMHMDMMHNIFSAIASVFEAAGSWETSSTDGGNVSSQRKTVVGKEG